ncbi:unnamed protein product (macronuclear) [Paramecium tetraurelia]|uniref:Protein kinase domain-containing protein n=1 Tax=Paramecium tetraurelia TaxID=5888 RepID=A0CJV4_PARTE|nr:uncharacterized protein GSPATT00000783001 [Paramecium tetraurelia]CAK71071.1 unnamed protein product [Paramecium tetraurelia]|eukprot:XP_001438468.1 hypothetical protein (macronuclear) [Paramecium tetraurelia strain d4-2]
MQMFEIIICYRKHLIADQIYEIRFTDNALTLTNVNDHLKSLQPKRPDTPKYIVPLNWSSQISWQLTPKENAFGFWTSPKKFKWFHVKQSDLLILKKILSKFVSFTKVQDFYEATEHLATGSNSQVYQVVRKSDKSDNYVTKCITKEAIQNSVEKMNGIFDELNILKQLNHPNLPRFEEFYVGDGTYYIVLEYCRGQSLNSYIKELKHQLNVRIIQNILWELLQGVAYLHSLNIIHRDIKPENIILNIQEKKIDLKIVDFGLSVKLEPNKELKKCGTPGYVAPEIINLKNGKYGLESDIFSVGCVFYKLLLRKDLFYGETQNEILSANRRCLCNIQNLSLIHIPITAQNLLSEMLQEDPRLRIKATSALQHHFFRENFRISTRNIPLLLSQVRASFHTQTSNTKQLLSDDDIHVEYFNNELPPINQIPVFLDYHKNGQKITQYQENLNSQSTDSKFLFRNVSKSTG